MDRQWGTDGELMYFGTVERQYAPMVQDKTYVGSSVVVTQAGTTRRVDYLLTDRLGSVDALADSSGAMLETRGFDAFGKPRSGSWADATKLASTTNSRHGFTGHEHLNSLSLIHMNGREYDYNLGRFTGVDPVIQFPLNSQSLNPYSYILNNPLSGTDPTGYMMDDGCNRRQSCQMGKNMLSTLQAEVAGAAKSMGAEASSGRVSAMREARANGAQSGQGPRQLAAKAAADILSKLQQEPLGATGGVATKSAMQGSGRDYTFPIENVSVEDVDGVQQITGHFKIDGTAADAAVIGLRSSFSNVSGETSAGRKWKLSFTFEVVQAGGEVHMGWMTRSDLRRLQREYSRQYGASVSEDTIVASTEYPGSNRILFNPLYRSVDSIATRFGLARGEATDVCNFVQGSFAHEFSHSAGMYHTPNSSNSMASYSMTRRVNNNDRARWCTLAGGSACGL